MLCQLKKDIRIIVQDVHESDIHPQAELEAVKYLKSDDVTSPFKLMTLRYQKGRMLDCKVVNFLQKTEQIVKGIFKVLSGDQFPFSAKP